MSALQKSIYVPQVIRVASISELTLHTFFSYAIDPDRNNYKALRFNCGFFVFTGILCISRTLQRCNNTHRLRIVGGSSSKSSCNLTQTTLRPSSLICSQIKISKCLAAAAATRMQLVIY